MEPIVRIMKSSHEKDDHIERLLTREWLVTNGLGGYASGTIGGIVTRRYHSYLTAALPAPLGRIVMLNHLSEVLKFRGGREVQIGARQYDEEGIEIPGASFFSEFRLEYGLPIWRYKVDDIIVEKTILMPYMQNTVHITYKLIAGDEPLRIELRPSLHFRPHEASVTDQPEQNYVLNITGKKIEVISDKDFPPLRFVLYGERSVFTSEGGENKSTYYRSERDRGYEFSGMLWNPGYFRVELFPGKDATLVASTENWHTVLALKPGEAIEAESSRRKTLLDNANEHLRTGIAAELVFAADQFIITPAGRAEDAVRVSAAGSSLRSIIAGYHWFTDWGRDTMISLEGLTLITGRHHEAHWILKTFAHYVRDGLIPNLFPEGQKEGLYHTADATLWFFHAIDKYISITGDKGILKSLLPILKDIAAHHLKGTKFGIGVDPDDGLLKQGAEGYQLTWMDAKVEDWVVTPRRGKAVEINALWYNALCLLSDWLLEEGETTEAAAFKELSEKTKRSFNQKFWYEEKQYLYDIVEGEYGWDNACRPNQIFSFSLKYPVLEKSRWESVLNIVREKLLTPVGLRSLSPGHRDYKSKYFGDLRARDAAYHQGTVWGWLIGPFIDAWMKVYPDDIDSVKIFLSGFENHLYESCIGSVSEIFDAEAPYTARGCIAQAWSVAELLRCYLVIMERTARVNVDEQWTG